MRSSKTITGGVLACLIAILCASCTGKGDGGGTPSNLIGLSPLLVTDKVSVVTPQTSASSGKPMLAGNLRIAPLLFGAVVITDLTSSSDFVSDKVSVYVNERSLESFRSVNEILCMIGQSRYDLMLNKGPYRAQVDKNLCSSSRDSASSAGQSSTDQSSGSTMPQYETWTVDSYRTSAQAPHIVRVWVHSPPRPGEPDTVITAQMVITEGADTAPPYGIFKTNFKALDKQTLSTVLYKGFLNAERDPVMNNKVVLKFSTEDKDSYIIEKAALDKSSDGTGAGSVLKVESYPGIAPKATRFNLAYDTDHFLRTDSTGTVCLNRKIPDVSAWRYGLYNQNGDRLKQDSGFPVRKGSDYGWIGYWGSYFPNNVTVNDGDSVLKHDYTTNSDTAYTIRKSGGKLKKHTLKITDLGHIQNIPLIWSDGGVNYQVVWTGSVFQKIAKQNPAPDYTWSTCGPTTTCGTGVPPYTINLSDIPWPDMAFWSQSLSGLVIVKLQGSLIACTGTGPFSCTADSSTPVVVYTENLVYPNDPVPAALACFDNCPDAANLTTATPFQAISSYQTVTPSLATHATFSFDTTAMLLTTVSGTPVILSSANSAFTNGITSGPLFDPAYLTMDPSPLHCNWDAVGGPYSTCGSNAWSVLPEFYTWETGPNDWNKFTGLIDTLGDPVTFDPPRQVLYTHNEAGKFNGMTFYLEYTGFGDLHGIPGKCVNIDTAADADCSTSGSNPAIRWVPEFSIPDTQADGTLTEVTDMTTLAPFLVKALEKEERMKVAAPGSCASLDTTAYVLPSMSSWIDPIIGNEPIITAPPAVVGGVVQ